MSYVRTATFAGLFLVFTTVTAGGAQGQIAPGQSGRSTTQYFGAAQAMLEMAAFGRCYAKMNRDEALSLIATRPTSREEVETYRKLFGRDNLLCLMRGTTLNVPPAYVRGAIAEGLLRSGAGIPADLMLPAPKAADVTNLSDAARCYAAGHRDQVQALLATKPATKPEFEAVSALMGELDKCLPAGVKLQFDATVIRYRLVEALLRLPPTTTPASGQ